MRGAIYSTSTRRLAALAAAWACAACLGTAHAADKPAPHVVLDPHYGDTLFEFYQGRYFSAVSNLMVSQHFGRVSRHADEAEVLRGGLLLSYGLHREAGDIFAKLIDKTTEPAVRDRAWYYLAKIRYQRGLLPEAEEAIDRVGQQLPPELIEEAALLKANLLMARADYAAAATLLDAETKRADQAARSGWFDRSVAGTVARYNLGVALVRSGEVARGSAILDEIGRAPAADEEARSLRDKANVAMGFTALQGNKPEQARAVLERVRLQGLHSNKALLGFGWAADAMKQPRLALVPWAELVQRDVSDPAVLEARIALPYALTELGAYGQALAQYQDAIAVFEREDARLDESIAAIRTGKLLEGLLERNPGEEAGWFWNIGVLPEMPHSAHLTAVLAQHEFQEGFKNWRDLRFLSRRLEQWQTNLAVLGDMLGNRRLAFSARVPRALAQSKNAATGLAAQQERRNALAAELSRVEYESDVDAFADKRQQDLRARIDSAEQAAQALQGAGGDAADARERLRLARGALTWELAQGYSPRLWEAQKSLKALDAALADARQREARLAAAQQDEPARFDAFEARLAGLDLRIRDMQPRIAALGRELQNEVQELAVAQLVQQKERLTAYAMQARFAVAQLYDRANQAGASSDATRK